VRDQLLAAKPLPCEGDELLERCYRRLSAGRTTPGRRRGDRPKSDRHAYAYVVYDHTRARNFEVIRRWLNLQDIWLAGRYSEWEYYNSDHAFLAGKRVALEVMAALVMIL